MTEEKKVTADRNSRDSEAHDKESRRKPWRPVRRQKRAALQGIHTVGLGSQCWDKKIAQMSVDV